MQSSFEECIAKLSHYPPHSQIEVICKCAESYKSNAFSQGNIPPKILELCAPRLTHLFHSVILRPFALEILHERYLIRTVSRQCERLANELIPDSCRHMFIVRNESVHAEQDADDPFSVVIEEHDYQEIKRMATVWLSILLSSLKQECIKRGRKQMVALFHPHICSTIATITGKVLIECIQNDTYHCNCECVREDLRDLFLEYAPFFSFNKNGVSL